MMRHDLIVIGAGPAGLSAAIEAARLGMDVAVFDENARPGGQLFKQIHKFFGSKEHHAKERGFRIGEDLLADAEKLGVAVHLNATVMGIYEGREVLVKHEDETVHAKADAIIIATGAAENMIPFTGWDKPGVIGAGAAQALMNLQGVMPGKHILMVGSGNVGLVVSFQLLQAGCEVAAVIDAAPRIGGYGVHAAKVARTGVPFYTRHTVVEALGKDRVEGAVIAEVDDHFQPIPGTEKTLDVDTICIAVGLSPMSQLADTAGCDLVLDRKRGGTVPVIDEYGETSVPNVYCAGDAAGIEEASTAMILGRIAAIRAAEKAGFLGAAEFTARADEYAASLSKLRRGMFAPQNKGRTDMTETDEGYPLSKSLLAHGFLEPNEVSAFPCATVHEVGVHPVIECTQNIPCNPCQDACRFGCITVGDDIVKLPVIDETKRCTGCGMCVASCSGQAIFLVDEAYEPGYASVGIPYEFVPVPKAGARGHALNRAGAPICDAEVVSVKYTKAMDKTVLLTMKVPAEFASEARFYRD
jgi:NADPH-dependent 2,4-dienoyl-CoA reductase/sulfur reductase-like enzyme/Pyruvate/2-oxoacid:ferredoxin oxidoreductase delta subunit